MMEQGSLADLLTLAKSGDDNKLGEMMAMMNGGMGGQQWMWWILIILFAFGGFGVTVCLDVIWLPMVWTMRTNSSLKS